MNAVSAKCDYIVMSEELLSKDAVDFNVPEAPEVEEEGEDPTESVVVKLNAGAEVQVVDLASCLESPSSAHSLIDYVDSRNRAILAAVRTEVLSLRKHRDNSTLNAKGAKGKGVAGDFMAKQREFKLNKKISDLEDKMTLLKEDGAKTKGKLAGMLSESNEEKDRYEKEMKRFEGEAIGLRPLVKEMDETRGKLGRCEFELKESKERGVQQGCKIEGMEEEWKVEKAALFKANIKLKNNARDMDELEKNNGSLKISEKQVNKDKKEVEKELARRVREEKERLEDGEDVGLQFSPEMRDCGGCQTDFVGKEGSLRQTNGGGGGFGSKMWARPVVMATFGGGGSGVGGLGMGMGMGMGMSVSVASGMNTHTSRTGLMSSGGGSSSRRFASDTNNLPSINMSGLHRGVMVRSASAAVRPRTGGGARMR